MVTKLRFALFALLIALATACGGGDETGTDVDAGTDASTGDMSSSNSDTGPQPDAGDDTGGDTNTCDDDQPSVATNPPSPVLVGFDDGSTTIRLDFDEPVTGVEPMAFTVDNGAEVESVGGMDDIYDVTVAGLVAETTYTLTLPAEVVRDECDNPLDEDLVITIEVGADPCDSDTTPPELTVSPTPPIELMTGTTTTAVTLLFSEEIQGVTPTADNGASVASVENPQGNDWVVTLENLADGVTTVTVPTSTLDACGNALAAAVEFDVVVGNSDNTPPMVISSTPNNGETGVALDSDVVFEFSEAMDTAAGTIDLTANGSDITFTSSWSSGDRTLTLNPTNDFQNGDGIVAVLNNFADPSGNALPNEVLAFTALPDPCVFDTTAPVFSSTPTSPINLAPGTTGTTVVLNFSEAVSGVSAATLSIDRGATIQSVTPTGDNYAVSLANLATGTNTLTVPSSVTDLCGNTLGVNRTVEIISPSTDQTPPTVTGSTPADGSANVARGTDIIVNWSEPMNQTAGFATIRVGGFTRNRTLTWDDSSTLRLDPTVDFNYGEGVEVILSNFADVNGNTAALDRVAFTIEPDPCAVYPATVTVTSGAQDGVLGDTGGEVWGIVQLSDAFPLQEAQLSITPVTGTGSLVAGSLTGANRTYAFRVAGTAPNDVYTVAIGTGTQNNGCTTLTPKSYALTVPDTISVVAPNTACPLPAPATSSFNGGDVCDSAGTATPSNDTNATATDTGLTVDAIGDVISFSGVYDSDHSPSDFDYFSFDVVEDGVTPKDLMISAYHGCNYTGTPSSDDWELRLEEDTGFGVGDIFYGLPYVRDAFDANTQALARATRTVTGPSGTNTYVLELNEQGGGSWCMDFRVFVEVVDTGRPAACENTPISVEIENTPQTSYANEFTGEAEIDIVLSNEFGSLTANDIVVTPLGNARGSLKPGSLTLNGSSYTAQIGGVQPGETYLVTLAPGNTGCTSVLGSGFFVTITDNPTYAGDTGACPLPSPLPQHYTGVDACNAQTNGSFASAEPTGLSLTNVGDNLSVAGTLDSDLNDDFYSFTINENGTNIYTFDVTLIYGCDFADTSGVNDELTISVLDGTGSVVSSGVGSGIASTLGDTWQSATTTAQVAGGAGANTYYLQIDDQTGSGLCMDYIAYVELTDISGNGICLGSGPTTNLSSTAQSLRQNAGSTVAGINFDAPYDLAAGDLSLVANTGTGTIQAGSFTKITNTSYEVTLTGVADGDSYTLSVAGGTDSCGTTFGGGSIAVSIADLPTSAGSCPLPPTLAQHFQRTEACAASDTNSSRTTAAVTGFTVSSVGDAFSIGSTYDTSGSPGDNDWFSFQINAVAGTTYDFDIRLAYGCTLNGTPSGVYAPDIQLRNSSGTSLGSDISGGQTYTTISSGTTYGYGAGTRSFTASTSGLQTLYIWLDDDVASGFCFDYVAYVTMTAAN